MCGIRDQSCSQWFVFGQTPVVRGDDLSCSQVELAFRKKRLMNEVLVGAKGPARQIQNKCNEVNNLTLSEREMLPIENDSLARTFNHYVAAEQITVRRTYLNSSFLFQGRIIGTLRRYSGRVEVFQPGDNLQTRA